MTEDITNIPYSQQMPTPNPDLKSLDRLVGTWKQSGGIEGEITYEWMDDGNILSGGWVYPGGGGYEATSTRVK